MFDAVELGEKVSKEDYKKLEVTLRTQLLDIQNQLREANLPVMVIVSGVEGAGKGEVVNRLSEWLDTRGVETHAYWNETDEERERPFFWRFWRKIPSRGSIGIMFGSWYTQPIVECAFHKISIADLEVKLNRVVDLENMLTRDGALIIKLWFHLSKEMQSARLKDDKRLKKLKVKSIQQRYAKHYDEFVHISERAIRQTDTGKSPWYLIDASNKRYRDLTVGRILIDAISQRLTAESKSTDKTVKPNQASLAPIATSNILDQVDLNQSVSRDEYKKQLAKYQNRLGELTWQAHHEKRSSVVVFEGWDAAGKGGAIRRVTSAIDARLYRTISIAAPTDEELAHHYLWRFWRQIPQAGYVTLYDRSWYGRVLVERVEGFAEEHEWMRAYQEINRFEEQLFQHGTIINKFWLHISPEEQLKRFKEREKVAWKQYKITAEDWRNRDRWIDYENAISEMVMRTSTEHSRWHVIAGNDKKFSRVAILKALCRSLEQSLSP